MKALQILTYVFRFIWYKVNLKEPFMFVLVHIRGGIFSGVCNYEVQTSHEWTRSHIFKDKASAEKIRDSYQEDGIDMSGFGTFPLSLVRECN